MDFQGLTRRELQALCKRNKIPANQTNLAMAHALQALSTVEGIEDLSQLEKGFQTPANSRTNQGATRKKTELPPGAIVIELEDSVAPVSRVTTRRTTAIKSSVLCRRVSSEEGERETKNDADLEFLQSPLPMGAATERKATTKKDTKSLVTQSNLKMSVRRSARLKSVHNASDELPSVVTKFSNNMSAEVSELTDDADELKDIAAETAVGTGEIAGLTILEIEEKPHLFPSSNDGKELIEKPEELTENLAKATGEAATNVEGVDEAGLFPSSNGGDLQNPGGEIESYSAVEVLEAMTCTEESQSEVFDEKEETAVVALPSITNSRSKKMAVKIGSVTKEQDLTESIPRKVVDTFEVANRAGLCIESHDLPNAGSEETKLYKEKVVSGDIQYESLLPKELMPQSDENKSDALPEKGERMSGELDEVDDTGNFISESLLPEELMPQSDENKSDALLEKGDSMYGELDEVDDTGNFISESLLPEELLMPQSDENKFDALLEKGDSMYGELDEVDDTGNYICDTFSGEGEIKSYVDVDEESVLLVKETESLNQEENVLVDVDEENIPVDVDEETNGMQLANTEEAVIEVLNVIRELAGQTVSNPGLNVVELAGQEVPTSFNPTATPSVLTAKERDISASNLDRVSPFLIKYEEESEGNSFVGTEKTPKKESVVKTQVEEMLIMGSEKKTGRKTGATPGKSDGKKKTTEGAADKENNGCAYGLKKESAKKPLQENLKDLSLRKLRVMCKEKFSALQPLDHNCLLGDGNVRK